MDEFPENGLLPVADDSTSWDVPATGDRIWDAVVAVLDLVLGRSIVWPAEIDGELRRPPDAHILDHLVRQARDLTDNENVYVALDWHPRAGTVVVVAGGLPTCDLCAKVGDVALARYDAPLSQLGDTRWAYLCPSCYTVAGTGMLGLGLGQYLMEPHEVPILVRAALKRARTHWGHRGVNHPTV